MSRKHKKIVGDFAVLCPRHAGAKGIGAMPDERCRRFARQFCFPAPAENGKPRSARGFLMFSSLRGRSARKKALKSASLPMGTPMGGRILEGMDEREFLRCYEEWSDALFRHCYFRVFERERARELVQETFTRAWAYLSAGQRIENMRAFLYRVANNLIIDESRKPRALSLDALHETDGFDPPGKDHLRIGAGASVREVMKALARVAPEKRELIVLRHVNGFGPKEIAEITGDSENVISVRLHRAVQELRRVLTGELQHNHHAGSTQKARRD